MFFYLVNHKCCELISPEVNPKASHHFPSLLIFHQNNSTNHLNHDSQHHHLYCLLKNAPCTHIFIFHCCNQFYIHKWQFFDNLKIVISFPCIYVPTRQFGLNVKPLAQNVMLGNHCFEKLSLRIHLTRILSWWVRWYYKILLFTMSFGNH